MALSLTPAQQEALEQFDADSDAARDAQQANLDAQAALLTAEDLAAFNAQAAIDTQVKALESAQAFIDTMIPPKTPVKPT